ncbi:MAG: hypothetical protein HOV81_03120 [Kofleriaceae bacterium]|nr:hypothetical protein [Kofleriaceae bacterium]
MRASAMDPVDIGGLLGALNMLVIAVGIGATYGGSKMAVSAAAVAAIGILPGIMAGAFVGALADALRRKPVWLRVTVLFGSALLLVLGLAAIGDMFEFAALSSIPTFVAVLALERWTRERDEVIVPLARVR